MMFKPGNIHLEAPLKTTRLWWMEAMYTVKLKENLLRKPQKKKNKIICWALVTTTGSGGNCKKDLKEKRMEGKP